MARALIASLRRRFEAPQVVKTLPETTRWEKQAADALVASSHMIERVATTPDEDAAAFELGRDSKGGARKPGAGDRNRTDVHSLGSCCLAIRRHPQAAEF